MRVLHIETGRHLYGGALQVHYLMRGLKEKGIDNLLACPSGSEIAAAEKFAEVFELPMAGDLDLRFPVALLQLVRRCRPDLVHVHSRRGADWWGGLVARRCGVKSLITRRVDNPESRWLAGLKYRPYDRVIAISEGIRKVLGDAGVPPRVMGCIHSAVDVATYDRPCDDPWFRREFALSPEDRVVGVVAQLIPRKGHRYLLDAAPAILKGCPETRFLFLGRGPLRERLEAMCRERGLLSKVIFAGFRNDLHRILPCLDLLVHPATMEGLGVSLLQASVARLPIVAGRAGGIPEIVEEGINGFLIPPGNTALLATRVVQILQDQGLSMRLGERGRQMVEQKFSVSAMVEAYHEIYKMILG